MSCWVPIFQIKREFPTRLLPNFQKKCHHQFTSQSSQIPCQYEIVIVSRSLRVVQVLYDRSCSTRGHDSTHVVGVFDSIIGHFSYRTRFNFYVRRIFGDDRGRRSCCGEVLCHSSWRTVFNRVAKCSTVRFGVSISIRDCEGDYIWLVLNSKMYI